MLKQKNKLVNNVKNFYKGKENIIKGFKNGMFPVYYGNRDKFSEDEDDDDGDDEKQEEQEEQKPIQYDYKILIKQITDEEKDI